MEDLRVDMKEELSSVVGVCTGLREDLGRAPLIGKQLFRSIWR